MCARHPLRRGPLISPPTPRVAAPACQDYYVIAAVRDPAKMHAAAEKAGVASTDYAAVELQLASLQSVKDLTKDLKGSLGQRGLDRLVCNAVRLPTAAPPPRHQAAATRPPPTRPYSSLTRVGGVPADRPQAPLH